MKIDSTNSKHGGLMNAKRPHSKKFQDEGAFSFLLSFFLVEGASSFYFDQMLASRLNFEFHASLQVGPRGCC
ncbi:hypothetical protein Peur_042652 [Populus x canadensis]